jgi:hypothetical protein
MTSPAMTTSWMVPITQRMNSVGPMNHLWAVWTDARTRSFEADRLLAMRYRLRFERWRPERRR